MKFISQVFICLLFLLCAVSALAQPSVTVEEVVSTAIQKNYDVQLLRNTSDLAGNDRRYAFGLFIPTLNASGNYQNNNNNTRNVTFSDVETIREGVKSTNTQGSVQLSWTLFDGTRMFATRKRLTELALLGEINVRNQMMNTAAAIMTTYYNIARQKQQLEALGELQSVSEERVKLAERKLQVGTGGKPELLQARIDLNAIRTSVLAQKTLIQQLKDQMNGSLAMSLPEVYDVGDTIPTNLHLTLDEIITDIENTNQQLASAKQNIEVFEVALRETRALRSPVIAFNSAYNYNQNQNMLQVNPAAQKYTRIRGYNYGLSVTVPILNGMNVTRQISAAKISLERQKVIYEQQRTLVMVGVKNAFVNYDNARKTLIIEEETILLARENVTIMLEGFKRGINTFIELRTAQQSLADAYNRLIAARYNAKVSEIELLRLKGALLR
ncbi:MAG: TolC family protein [Bacteroidetes bacterium]|nr:TolC family protein [Bacteroidota bacterium]